MAKKQTKDKHFIPSEFTVVTEYEKEFIKVWISNTAEAVAEVLDHLAKETASAIKDGIEDNIEKGHNIGDLHPTEPWIWTEYKPGKFDWRKIKNNTKPTKVSKVWEMNLEVETLKNEKECMDFLIQKGVVVKHRTATLQIGFEELKKVTNTLYNLKQKFDFKPIMLSSGRIRAIAQATAGEEMRFNQNIFKSFDNQKSFDSSNKKYLTDIQNNIDFLDRRIKHTLASNLNADISNLQKNKDIQQERLKNFKRWTYGFLESSLEDIVIHEMGHILNAQLSGGCGNTNFWSNKSQKEIEKFKKLNKERNEIFKKYLKEKQFISEYSTVKPAEFFAESFVAYLHEDKELPDFVKSFLDKYFTETKKIK